MVTTLTYILGIILGALITSTVLYILKLRNTVKSQDELINEQHELIKTLTMTAFGDKIKARIKQIEEEEKNMLHNPGNACDNVEAPAAAAE